MTRFDSSQPAIDLYVKPTNLKNNDSKDNNNTKQSNNEDKHIDLTNDNNNTNKNNNNEINKNETTTEKENKKQKNKHIVNEEIPVSSPLKRKQIKQGINNAPKAPAIRYKKVNTESSNRRTNSRIDEMLKSNGNDNTPERNNKSKINSFTNTTRFTFKINLPSSSSPDNTLKNIFKEFFSLVKKADNKAVLLPWKETELKKDSIRNINDLPTNMFKLKTYFGNFYTPKKDTKKTVYANVYIGFFIPIEDLRGEIMDWTKECGHGLYKKMLQVDSSTEIGWLLYTTKAMDAGALADEISDLTGVAVGLRWKIIDMAIKGNIPENKKVFALALEVKTEDRWMAERKLLKYFGKKFRTVQELPNGIRVRFIKSMRNALNTREKGKLEVLIARQKAFLTTISQSANWDILTLDYSADEGVEPTLRQMIMSLKTKEDESIPLFHNVDLDWQGRGYIFEFSPKLKREAECTIHTLLPTLKYLFPNVDVEDNFTPECSERCDNMVYDITKKQVIDPDTDQLIDETDDNDLIGFTLDLQTNNSKPNDDESRPTYQKKDKVDKAMPRDSDSISTLRGNGAGSTTSRFVPPPPPRVQRETHSNDTLSMISATSTVTIETIASLESKVEDLTKQVATSNTQYATILNKLDAMMKPPTPKKDDTPNGASTAGSNNSSSGGVL